MIVIQKEKAHYQIVFFKRNYRDRIMRVLQYVVFVLTMFWGMTPKAEVSSEEFVHLAVSSTIQGPLTAICRSFSQKTNFRCQITSAPTGHLYAHVMHGMAYDLLFSSDETYTQGLINAQKVDPKSRFTLAKGRIVLWSADENATAESLKAALLDKQNKAVVIANPGVSTYGGAAKEVLQMYNLWHQIQGRLIYGRNIVHAYELVVNKRAPLGFVSLSQLSPNIRSHKKYWEPDPKSYKPVHYEVVKLNTSKNDKATAAFIAHLGHADSCRILTEAGFNCSREKLA
jgi:molybdate transport system substrate-binding protein